MSSKRLFSLFILLIFLLLFFVISTLADSIDCTNAQSCDKCIGKDNNGGAMIVSEIQINDFSQSCEASFKKIIKVNNQKHVCCLNSHQIQNLEYNCNQLNDKLNAEYEVIDSNHYCPNELYKNVKDNFGNVEKYCCQKGGLVAKNSPCPSGYTTELDKSKYSYSPERISPVSPKFPKYFVNNDGYRQEVVCYNNNALVKYVPDINHEDQTACFNQKGVVCAKPYPQNICNGNMLTSDLPMPTVLLCCANSCNTNPPKQEGQKESDGVLCSLTTSGNGRCDCEKNDGINDCDDFKNCIGTACGNICRTNHKTPPNPCYCDAMCPKNQPVASYCDLTAFACSKKKTEGDDCKRPEECSSGKCNNDKGKCSDISTSEKTPTETTAKSTFALCVDNKKQPINDGEKCNTYGECLNGKCLQKCDILEYAPEDFKCQTFTGLSTTQACVSLTKDKCMPGLCEGKAFCTNIKDQAELDKLLPTAASKANTKEITLRINVHGMETKPFAYYIVEDSSSDEFSYYDGDNNDCDNNICGPFDLTIGQKYKIRVIFDASNIYSKEVTIKP